MNPSQVASTSIEPAVQPHDRYYNPSSSPHYNHPSEYSQHHSHSTQHNQSPSTHDHFRSYVSTTTYQSHQGQHPSFSTHTVKHTEGYEGRVRNTNRDHNDHLVTDLSARDQQHHHDQYHRDPTYGFLKHSERSAYSRLDDGLPPLKYNLPPILAPEEPFYRSDLPGRHMRYFSNVTSQDRENPNGYVSSARHVAPSNTTGNFGHGPPLGQAMDRFGRSQGMRLPSLYTALPDQRPGATPSGAQARGQSESMNESTYGGPSTTSPRDHSHHQQSRQHPSSPRAHSPGPSPVESPNAMSAPSSRSAHTYHPSHPYPQQPQQHSQPMQRQQQQHQPSQHHQHMLKPKAILPRSIAPAPISGSSPPLPVVASPLAPKKKTSTHPYPLITVKMEAKEHPHQHPQGRLYPSQPLPQQQQPSPQQHQHQQHQRIQHTHYTSNHVSETVAGKRKWAREHSPIRVGPRLTACVDASDPMDESSQELHLLSRRIHVDRAVLPPTSTVSRPMEGAVSQAWTGSKKSTQLRMQRYQMTTIRCWHGAIAQKSYGIEKRYLCPPPMVQVSAGVNAKHVKTEQPHVTMSVIHEKLNGQQGENLMEQDCSLDDALKCSFRNLHVTGTGSDSSKRFKLGLQVFLNRSSALPTAIMDSSPIPIISKPSKKTAKAGNASCFILNGMSVSLLNRINAQTVRTKYMAVDNNAVCAKIGSWSSFTIKMVKPPPAPPVKIVPASMGVFRAANHSTKFVPIRMKGDPATPVPLTPTQQSAPNATKTMPSYPPQQAPPQPLPPSTPQRPQQQPQQEPTFVFSNSEPVLYGAEIVLINDMTGIMTDRLVIRKVENGKVVQSGSGPVSQMQKIVLQHPDRVHPEDGRPYYLSASSIGSPKIEGKIPLQAAMDKSPLLEYRTSSKKASIMDLTDAVDEDEEEEYDEEGVYQGKRNSLSRKPNRAQDSVAVDDFVCWTIAGIAKFDYTYFGPIPASIDTEVDPRKVPLVLSRPHYSAHSNTLQMKVKNVFEKLSAEEESRRAALAQEDSYDRRLTLSEFVYKRCEDVQPPMQDEEGPIQLWLAQHGPIRMRRRALDKIETGHDLEGHQEQCDEGEESDDEEQEESFSSSDEVEKRARELAAIAAVEDRLPKIPTKSNGSIPLSKLTGRNLQHHTQQQQHLHQQQQLQQQHRQQSSSHPNQPPRQYGGSHLPASLTNAHPSKKARKLVSRALGLEAELPYGCEVRAAHDAKGNAKAELDILMVERESGIAYRTGFKVTYTRERESTEWIVEVLG